MIWTAAKGMSFLEMKKIVHRDLAVRNLLVIQINGKYCVKISDFGMSRETDTDYYKSNTQVVFPVRWSAPETLTLRKFTHASDVWSFGVVCWEILSFGILPYFWLSNRDVAEKVVTENERLNKPTICTDDLWIYIETFFNIIPENRPTFENIMNFLDKMGVELKFSEDQKSKSSEEIYDIVIQKSEINRIKEENMVTPYENNLDSGYIKTGSEQ